MQSLFVTPGTVEIVVDRKSTGKKSYSPRTKMFFDSYSSQQIDTKAKMGGDTILALDIDVQGARKIKEKYLEALFIFIVPRKIEEAVFLFLFFKTGK